MQTPKQLVKIFMNVVIFYLLSDLFCLYIVCLICSVNNKLINMIVF